MPLYRPNSWRALLVAVFKKNATSSGGGGSPTDYILTELSEELLTEAGVNITLE